MANRGYVSNMNNETQSAKKRRWPMIILILVALTYLGFRGLVFVGATGRSLHGVVTDAETGQPIEGAIVAANWVGTVSMIVDSQTQCYWVESAITDENGEYELPRWWSTKRWVPLHRRYINIVAYKSGYHPGYKTRRDVFDVSMDRNTDPYDKRFAELKRLVLAASCLRPNNGEKALYPLYKAMSEDAARYATSYEERKDIRWFQEIAAGMLVDDELWEDYQRKVDAILKKGLP